MLRLRKIAVTGTLSCGKSSVCRILKELGAYVLSADEIAHQLLTSDAALRQKIIDLLGPSILTEKTKQFSKDSLDRSRIAQIVFKDLNLLKALEKLIHPAVYREINKEYQHQQQLPHPPSLFIVEIPLLFETDRQCDFDFVVTVGAPEESALKRFKETTNGTEQEFKNRMARQLPLQEKMKLADEVIMNNGSLSDLRQATTELYKKLINQKK